MDLTQDVIYRNFYVNEADIKSAITSGGGANTGISGCVIESADTTDVDVVQFMEKRALQSGMDAGDVFLGSRRIRLSGVLYGTSRRNLFDRARLLRSAFNPVLAQQDEPADKGFQPLYFSIPTDDVVNYNGNKIDLRVLGVPRQLQMAYERDRTGGEDTEALAIPWRAVLVCRDPRIMGAEPQDYYLSGGSNETIKLINRGDFTASLNYLIKVTSTGAGSIVYSTGGATNTITVPEGTDPRIFRFNSVDNVLTLEVGGIQLPRADLIQFGTKVLYPVIPHAYEPEGHDLTITYTGATIDTEDSHVWFWEAYS